MAFTLPPPKNQKAKSQQSAYRAYINAHPSLRPYAQQLYRAATSYGVDPVYFASLINFESGGKPGATSSANAFGLAQIHIPTWLNKTDPRTGKTITLADIKNPTWNLNFGAYLFSRAIQQYGSPQKAYSQGYNPGYKGPGPFRDLPKGYVPTGTTRSPAEQAARAVETQTATKALTDPYIRINSQGKVVRVTDPKNALKVFGQPITMSQFQQEQAQINDLYKSYTGHGTDAKNVARILTHGYSRYQLVNALTQRPDFVGSPIWKQNAPGYEGVWSQIYGNTKADPEAIRNAIVNNLGGEGFAQTLRTRQDYVTSNEFKTNEAGLSSVYTRIYGVPDKNGESIVKQATLNGWSPDQLATYLRHQPQYTGSQEYQTKALQFASSLGLVFGNTPTLGPGPQGTNPNGAPIQAPKTDPRAAPAGTISPTSDLVVK